MTIVIPAPKPRRYRCSQMPAETQDPPSPCTGLCRLDPASGWCLGCGRSGDEIGRWTVAGAEEKKRILAGLPSRLARLPKP